jgi:hypothetical protein
MFPLPHISLACDQHILGKDRHHAFDASGVDRRGVQRAVHGVVGAFSAACGVRAGRAGARRWIKRVRVPLQPEDRRVPLPSGWRMRVCLSARWVRAVMRQSHSRRTECLFSSSTKTRKQMVITRCTTQRRDALTCLPRPVRSVLANTPLAEKPSRARKASGNSTGSTAATTVVGRATRHSTLAG